MRPVTSPSDCVLDGRVHSTSDAKRFSREEGKKQNVHELLKQEDRHGPKHKRKGLSPTGLHREVEDKTTQKHICRLGNEQVRVPSNGYSFLTKCVVNTL